MFGKVTGVQGKAHNFGGFYAAEDTVTGTWTHASGVAGTGAWSFIVGEDLERDELEIIGEKGRIMLSSFERPDTIKVTTNERETEFKFDNPAHISQNLVQQVVDELTGAGTCVSTGETAARTSLVLEQMVKGYYPDQER